MNTSARINIVLGLVAAAVTTAWLYAGPLTPPVGPIASTNKTLAEIEPRIAINAINTPGDADSLYKITQPGSYYLTGNITGVANKHGIHIDSSDVTIDLNGFTLRGVVDSLDGINSEADRITIRNGRIVAWGLSGIWMGFLSDADSILGVAVDGCNEYGIAVASASVLENCTAINNLHGFWTYDSVIRRCTARANLGGGFSCTSSTLTDCTTNANAQFGFQAQDSTLRGCVTQSESGSGFSVSGSTLTDCAATSSGQYGFTAHSSTIDRCSAAFNALDGIRAGDFCIITNNRCRGNGTAGAYSGIYLNGNDCRVENNHTVGNDGGIASSTGVGHFIARNYAQGNPAGNYILPSGGNFVGTIVGTNAAMNTSENCNVNISYP